MLEEILSLRSRIYCFLRGTVIAIPIKKNKMRVVNVKKFLERSQLGQKQNQTLMPAQPEKPLKLLVWVITHTTRSSISESMPTKKLS